MANTYSPIYIQVVFAVQCRSNLFREENKEELRKSKYLFNLGDDESAT
jgi:hypothetical protein